MALVKADRVKETSTTTGTGALTLGGAMTGYRAFSSVCTTNDTIWYAIQAVDGSGAPTGDWETGLGTYSGANTLTRTTVYASSNSNAAVNFAAGTKQVWCGMPAAKSVSYDAHYIAGAVPPNASDFTLINSTQTGATASLTNLASGRGFVLVANEGSGTGDIWAHASRSVPGGSSWSIITMLHGSMSWNSTYSMYGMFIKDSTGKCVNFVVPASNIAGWGNLSYDKWTNINTSSPSFSARTTIWGGACVNAPMWFKVVYNGSTFVLHTSNDGETWTQRYSISSTDYIGTPSTCGVCVDTNVTSNTTNLVTCYHWFQG